MKWGDHNLETQFKYGEISVSPAAMMAAGNKVSASYRLEMANKLLKGDINQAEYKKALLENLAANAKANKDEPVKSTGTNVSDNTANLRQQLLDGKITMAQYREMTKNGKDGEGNGETAKSETRQSRNFLQEALNKAREKSQEEEEQKEEKATKEKATKEKATKEKAEKAEKEPKEKTEKAAKEEKEEKEKEYEEDVDEGPMDYQKSKFFENLNRSKKVSGTQIRRSVSGRNSNPSVQKRTRSLNKRLYHSEMVHELKERFYDGR